ncbi:MAG TPA: amino acid permease [Myxococcaceae bacterium]|nr:amino acid permease [Myxococcaceae bacterium]
MADDRQREDDAAQLRRMGYAQQLLRDMGGFSNFAVSFSIISILTGAVTLYGQGLLNGGPLVMGLGWPLVSAMTMLVACGLAELASAYPTAGALYHWSSILGGRAWGFFTAWLNTLGQFSITAGIDYGLAQFLAPMFGWEADRPHVLGIYAAVLLSHAALNHVGVRVVARLNDLSAWYHLAGVALLVGALAFLAPHQDAAFLFQKYVADPSQGTYWGIFCLGLLQAQWTFTGYDASAHVTEETLDPKRNAPWGIVLSVAVSAVAGYAMLAAVTLAIQDLPATAAASNPFIHILTHSLGGRLGSAMVWMVIGAMWFCGLSSITSNSRMLFAFARDGGLPFSPALASVSPRYRSPHVAIWVSAAAALVVALWSDAYAAITALSTITLYASYALPIAAGLRARRTGKWTERGPWNLGRWSSAVNVGALLWVVAISLNFIRPLKPVERWSFGGALAALVAYWFLYMRARFKGPPQLASQAPPPSAAAAPPAG